MLSDLCGEIRCKGLRVYLARESLYYSNKQSWHFGRLCVVLFLLYYYLFSTTIAVESFKWLTGLLELPVLGGTGAFFSAKFGSWLIRSDLLFEIIRLGRRVNWARGGTLLKGGTAHTLLAMLITGLIWCVGGTRQLCSRGTAPWKDGAT